MANYQQLKATIEAEIYNNGQGQITGAKLQNVLKSVVDALGEGYTYLGRATLTTVPVVTDGKVFYLASTAGTYTNFGNLVVDSGSLTVLKYDGSWAAEKVFSTDSIVAHVNAAISSMDASVSAAIAEIEDIVDNLDTTSAADVQTIGSLLVEAGTACKVTQKTYNSKSSNEAEFVKKNTAFDAYYVADTGNKIYAVTVTMGGVDISSTAVKVYNASAAHVNIASVTGAVEIEVIATKAIVFEDNAVKALCVENWGGNYIEGEITEYEAAQVTTLNAVFYNNDTITKFNELRYFTGLTTLYRNGSGDAVVGQFHSCALLEEITIPKAPINDFRGAFRCCDTLEELDLSPVTVTRYRFDSVVQGLSSDSFPLKKVKLPSGVIAQNPTRAFLRAKKLTTIEIDGFIDFSEVTSFANFAISANSLTTITGTIIGIRASIDFSYCPLTKDSAMVIINGLATISGKTVTFKASTYNTLSADDIAIATAKGWTVASA